MPYWFDGNNLIGQSAAAAQAHPDTRRAFLSSLRSYRALRGGKFLVYFDGDDPGDSHTPPGVSVRYSAPISTDEAILRRLNEIRFPSEVIVVTNDRVLMSKCRNAGAMILSWREFESKMRAHTLRRIEANEPRDRIDVEEWVKYFGLDKKDI